MIRQKAKVYFYRVASVTLLLLLSQLAFATTQLDDLAQALEKESQAAARRIQPLQSVSSANRVGGDSIGKKPAVEALKPNIQKMSSAGKKTSSNGLSRMPTITLTSQAKAGEMLDVIAPKWNALKACLENLKMDTRYRTSEEEIGFLEEYVRIQHLLLERIEANRDENPDAERRRLIYANNIATQKLSECSDLSDGPAKTRYVYLVGQQAQTDGRVFETIAGTLISNLLKKICPLSEANCFRQIAVKQQIQKSDLLLYLKLLSPGSVKYLAYIGHGWSRGFLLGFKDMSVPSEWNVNMKITNLNWQAERQGAIYGDDMNYVGPIIAKALDPNATVALYACNNADYLGPLLAGQLPKSASVVASDTGMEYKAIPGTDAWSLTLPTGEQFFGPKLLMYPSKKNAFKKVAPIEFSFSKEFSELENPEEKKETAVGIDDLTGAVLTRVGRKESSHCWAGQSNPLSPSSQRLIVFDKQDRATITAIFKIPPPGHDVYEDDLEISYSDYDEKVKQVLRGKYGADRKYIEDLFTRINGCIDEGIKKYY